MLEVRNLTAGYDGVAILRDLTLNVGRGELVGLLGANNAGKSTLINVISGIVPVMSGQILLDGEDITTMSAPRRVEAGIVQVPEGRLVFPQMTVRENLQLGGFNPKARPERAKNLEHVLSLFPRLGERLDQKAGTLSGGEQQMVALGRGLMAGAKLLMLDEPSLGLSPLFVQFIFGVIDRLNAEGLTMLLVEQNLSLTLKHADRCYVLERGVIAVQGDAETVQNDPRTRAAYLGM